MGYAISKQHVDETSVGNLISGSIHGIYPRKARAAEVWSMGILAAVTLLKCLRRGAYPSFLKYEHTLF